MPTTKLTSKGQITIPRIVRDRLRLRTGDNVEFVVTGEAEAVMRPVTRRVDEVYGALHKPGRKRVSVEAMNAAVKRRMKGRK